MKKLLQLLLKIVELIAEAGQSWARTARTAILLALLGAVSVAIILALGNVI